MEGLEYEVIRSTRKTIAIQVGLDGSVTVRAPKRCSRAVIEDFVAEDYRSYQIAAGQALQERTAFFAEIMGVDYGRITVRDQRTRWGSCSAKGNLNFNWRLILAPGEVLDYVVVHELAHRREMNHSKRFWSLVEMVLPDYERRRRWLKENGEALMER